jgi:hypothetical protein
MRTTKNHMALSYNPKLKDRAKALRKAGNLPEVLLWNKLKNNQLRGLDFDRQKIIGNYVVDFYCAKKTWSSKWTKAATMTKPNTMPCAMLICKAWV